MTEYWYARRFPVGHWRNAMAPISPKARRVAWVFFGGIAAGLLVFFGFGLAGHWRIGAGILAVLVAYCSWYYMVVPKRRSDPYHTVEDYRAGRVDQAAPAAAAAAAGAAAGTVAIGAEFGAIDAYWRPRVAAEFSGQQLRLTKVKGEGPWHRHDGHDELYIVRKGALRVEFRSRVERLAAGEALVVPRTAEHRIVARGEAEVMSFAPKQASKAGNTEDPLSTAPTGEPSA